MKPNRLWLPMVGAILCVACIKGTLMHHFEHVDPEGWNRYDTLLFSLAPMPHQGRYDFTIDIRYANDFPYEGIWVAAETRLRHPSVTRRDTLYLKTTDENGTPVGKGLNLLQHSMTLYTLHLQPGQEGTLRLYHLMRLETMPDIREIGLKITETPN